MEDAFRSFWSVKTRAWWDAREVKNQGKRGMQDTRWTYLGLCRIYSFQPGNAGKI